VRAAREREQAEKGLATLFAEADCADLDGFHARAAQFESWAAAKDRRDTLEAKLRAALGDEDLDAAREALRRTPRADLEKSARLLETEEAALTRARDEALVEKGSANSEREAIEKESELATLRAQEETAREDLLAASEQWQTRVIAEWLLEAARRKFEAEHQPNILRAAGGYLETITRGRWVAIRAIPDESREEDRLRVVRFDDPERLHRLETLSRGTLEQVYLALRLALASDFPDPGVKLPLVLDDVLVNFSGSRRTAAAEAIASIASRVQVIAFTCHEEMRDALRRAAKDARLIELASPAHPDEAARKAKARAADRQLRLGIGES
ncbi:MAG TPA: hypothetical protein VMV18_14980, partial [bacterium]|nr:hypothetical protein [bacterium]